MELKEMIKVMQHYENGGEVDFREKRHEYMVWRKSSDPSWNWNFYDYRIKEHNKKVTIEKWLIKDVNSSEHFIMESSSIDTYKQYEKVKLIESYEVEL